MLSAVGTGLATTAIVLTLVAPQSRPTKAAAAELNDLASTASLQSNPTPAAGESLYSKQSGEVSESFSQVNGVSTPGAEATFAVTLETWEQSDGSVAYEVTFGNPQFASTAAETAWIQAGLPTSLPSVPQVGIAEGSRLVMDVSRLPTEPSELAAS